MLIVFACASVNGNLTLIDWRRLDLYFINLNIANTFLSHGDYAVPKRLHNREVMCKPFTVAWNLDDDKLFWWTLFVLEEIAHLEIHNFKKELNLWKVISRNFRFNLPTQWTLNFQKSTRLCDSVRTSAEKFMYRVLHETNLV